MTEHSENIVALAQRKLGGRIGTVGAQIERVLVDQSPEPIHDLRVSARRALYTLDGFRPLLDGPQFRRLRKRTRAILTAGGDVRDRDVALEVAAFAGLRSSCELARALAGQRQSAVVTLRRELERKRYRSFTDRWTQRIREMDRPADQVAKEQPAYQGETDHYPDWAPADSCASNAVRVLPGEAGRYLSMGQEACRGDQSPRTLHRLRLAGKRLRYMLETFHEIYGGSLDAILVQLKACQDSLGGVSDLDTTEQLLRCIELAGAVEVSEVLTTIQVSRKQKIRDFVEGWHRFTDESDPQRTWVEILEHGCESDPRESSTPEP